MSVDRPFEYRILGPFEVIDATGEQVDLTPMQRTILARLLIDRGQVVSTDRLMDDFWADSGTRSKLRFHISKLRQALDPEKSVRTKQPGYLIDIEPAQLDAARFAAMVDDAGEFLDRDPVRAAKMLRTALALWHGEALVDFAYLDWAIAAARPLEERRLVALEDRIQADIALGEHRAVVSELQGLVEVLPARERLWQQLMLSLYRSDRQVDAIRAGRRATATLGEGFGIDPGSELTALEERILQQDPELDAGVVPERTRYLLPADTSSFVGRAEEHQQIATRLRQARMVVLTGVGGIGKTRLALSAARTLTDDYANGVAFVGLEHVREPEVAAAEIARSLDIKEDVSRSHIERICDHLRDSEALLFIDNCEHLAEPVASVCSAVLGCAKSVSILATSRIDLGVEGEQLINVPPLSLPKVETEAGDVLRGGFDAIELFALRARSVRPDFTLSDENVDTVVSICHRLDGLPLAIELAAKWLNVLSLSEIDDRLVDSLDLLTRGRRTAPERHHTMRAAIEWSYNMLNEQQRSLLTRASVFRGSFGYRAAAGVCSGDGIDQGDVLDLIASLAEASLFVVEGSESVRYRLMETIRQFSSELLEAENSTERFRSLHADYFAELAEREEQHLGRPGEQDALSRLEADHDNLRAAHDRSLDADPESAARIGAALCWFWLNHGYHREARTRITSSLDASRDDPSRWRAELMGSLIYLETLSGNLDEARRHNDQLRTEAEVLDEHEPYGLYFQRLGEILWAEMRRREAFQAFEEAEEHFRAIGHRELMLTYVNLGAASVAMGETSRARDIADLLEDLGADLFQLHVSALADEIRARAFLFDGAADQAVELATGAATAFADLGLRHNEAISRTTIGRAAIYASDYARARKELETAIESHTALGDELNRARARTELARLAITEGDLADAMALLRDSLSVVAKAGYSTEIAMNAIVASELAFAENDFDRGQSLLHGAMGLLEENDAPLPAPLTGRIATMIEAAEAASGEAEFITERRGTPMTLHELIDAMDTYSAAGRR